MFGVDWARLTIVLLFVAVTLCFSVIQFLICCLNLELLHGCRLILVLLDDRFLLLELVLDQLVPPRNFVVFRLGLAVV